MQFLSARTLFHIVVVGLFATAPLAGAQVTINLTTTQQTNCTATTDANGLSLLPGSTNLQATGVTLTGTGCGGGGGGNPPQPQGFVLNVPANVTTNTPFQVSWAVTGAESCTGSASLNGNSVNLTGWTDSSSAISPRTVTTTQDGAYTLQLVCSNRAGSATSALANITSSTVIGNCPAGLQTNLTVCYDALFSSCAANADVTQFTNIWGRTTANGTISPFPGDQSPIFFRNFDKTKYIAAQVHVPATGLPTDQVGLFTHGGTFGGPNLTMAISATCGDFSPSAQYCLHADVNPEQVLVPWKVPTATGNYCALTPGQTYYVNIKVTNPTQSNPTCNGTAGTGNLCTISVQSNHTP